MVGLLFGIFIYFNGGITLGDKENHTVGIHGAQILYFILFTIFFSWPFWISVSLIEKYFKRLIVKWYLVAFELLAIILVIEKLTIVHPFILADNRHYTFYLWRRLIQPTWSLNAKYQMVPVYHFGIWVFISCLASSTNFLTAVLFIACTLATLIPSPLLEPRYYIVPYILWRMLIVKSSPKTSKFRIMAEIAWNAFVNFITVYMFVYKPFEWSQEPGALQRFMW